MQKTCDIFLRHCSAKNIKSLLDSEGFSFLTSRFNEHLINVFLISSQVENQTPETRKQDNFLNVENVYGPKNTNKILINISLGLLINT